MPGRPTRSPRIPKYRLHKASGQAVVTLGGRDVYLGRHGSPESHDRYHNEIASWQLLTRLPEGVVVSKAALTVHELFLAYWKFAQVHYQKNGRATSEISMIRQAIRDLTERHNHFNVDEFGPLALKTVRQAMIERGLSRGFINKQIDRIKRMFKWGVENELVRPEILLGLQAVAGLRKGRTEAREADPILPAEKAIIDGVLHTCSWQLAAMIRLQIATGMRPGEVVILRPCDVDRTKSIWVYEPFTHKAEHHSKRRRVYMGPKAQAILRPILENRLPLAFCFSPAEAERERRAKLSTNRMTPLGYGNRRGTNCVPKPKKQPRDHYDTDSYRRAIAYACKKRFPAPEGLEGKELSAWHKEHRFHPHQLRHNAATNLAKTFGIEAAQVVLGHSSLAVTQVYAERDFEKAAEIMKQVG